MMDGRDTGSHRDSHKKHIVEHDHYQDAMSVSLIGLLNMTWLKQTHNIKSCLN
jgi:hypothetical protein